MGNLFVDLLKAFVDMRRQDVDREIAAQGEPQGDDEEEEHQTERYANTLVRDNPTALLTWCRLLACLFPTDTWCCCTCWRR
jgi:hypothetical protein